MTCPQHGDSYDSSCSHCLHRVTYQHRGPVHAKLGPNGYTITEGTPMTQQVLIDYTNYRGERKVYRILPESIYFGQTEFHPKPQWLLKAKDATRDVPRTFAMADIHGWAATDGTVLPGGPLVKPDEQVRWP